MDRAELQSFPANPEQHLLAAKRKAAEGSIALSDAKRVKSCYDGSTGPDVKPPAITRIIPFPEKVC